MIADINAEYYYKSCMYKDEEVATMHLREEINKYLHYCKLQKELDAKTVRAYRADLEQFITLVGENDLDKEKINSYLL